MSEPDTNWNRCRSRPIGTLGALPGDFDLDGAGQSIPAGADLRAAYSAFGVGLTATSEMGSISGLPIAFNSSVPTGGDHDLGTPNEMYGGPGVGDGGGTNAVALGHLLIKAENEIDADGDGLVDVPDDDASGAMFTFTFDSPRCINSFDILDIEAAEFPATVQGRRGGVEIASMTAGGLGDNSVERVELGWCGVDQLVVVVQSSAALDNVEVCSSPRTP